MTDATMFERVSVSVTDGVADVRPNRPEKRNALDRAMFEALVKTGERLSALAQPPPSDGPAQANRQRAGVCVGRTTRASIGDDR